MNTPSAEAVYPMIVNLLSCGQQAAIHALEVFEFSDEELRGFAELCAELANETAWDSRAEERHAEQVELHSRRLLAMAVKISVDFLGEESAWSDETWEERNEAYKKGRISVGTTRFGAAYRWKDFFAVITDEEEFLEPTRETALRAIYRQAGLTNIFFGGHTAHPSLHAARPR